MSSKTEPAPSAPIQPTSGIPVQSFAAATKAPSRWPWLRGVEWLDEITVPHWGPEGDPSCALRVREL